MPMTCSRVVRTFSSTHGTTMLALVATDIEQSILIGPLRYEPGVAQLFVIASVNDTR